MVSIESIAQQAKLTLEFTTISRKPYINMKVIVSQQNGNELFEGITNETGKVVFLLPVGAYYEIRPGNTERVYSLQIEAKLSGAHIEQTFRYDPGGDEFNKKYAYKPAEIDALKKFIQTLPDTLVYKPALKTKYPNHMTFGTYTLKSLKGKPLANEVMFFSARKSRKVFVTQTNAMGKADILLLKGDTLDLSFKYDRNFDQVFCILTMVDARITRTYNYQGTEEIEKLKKEEEERMKLEKARAEKEEKIFQDYIKKEGISAIEGRKRLAEEALRIEKEKREKEEKEYQEYLKKIAIKHKAESLKVEKKHIEPKEEEFHHSVISNIIDKIFKRNSHWKSKLIVCDLTGSMDSYANQLTTWYSLNHMKEQNLQFVFFNDGDKTPDKSKLIGNTGGIYYSKSEGITKLIELMALVRSNGDGGDCPENNMEALLKAVKLAQLPYKEIVMIVDNNAPVKDIVLLSQFNIPVRIILCGYSDFIEPDYLKIAWKTKGSIHTMEEDINSIAKLLDGQIITIGGQKFQLMKNRGSVN